MGTSRIHGSRIQRLNEESTQAGDYVVYWMQQSQRAEHNDALEYAIQRANGAGLPLLVVFGLMDGYPEATLRHYRFMLEGLQETRAALQRRGIRMVVQHGDPDEVALRFASKAALLVCDRGYLRHQRAWRERVASEASCEVVQVEADVLVPVERVSSKAEYAARTIRPKIHRAIRELELLEPLRTTPLERSSLHFEAGHFEGSNLDLDDLDRILARLDIDRSVGPVSALYRGGTRQARANLDRFLQERFERYTDHRNRPETDDVTHLSAHLHFGQISPVYVALAVQEAEAPKVDREALFEELVVRRELPINFVLHTERYDRFDALPDWAKKTLAEHADDPREHVYTQAQLEAAETHDPYWNASMREMRETGYMHNYMRMYWGKKILEWTNAPEQAHRTALALNNRYFLDGRDPSSFANVAWVFGLHDRPWKERPIFGKVRYMSRGGLERKADPDAYVEKVDRLVARARG